MDETTLPERVEMLEDTVRELITLPARIEAVEGRLASVDGRVGSLQMQVVQLREELHGEFSAIRGEVAALGSDLRTEMRALNAETVARLETKIEAGDEETRRHMRLLHEDVIERIARLGEHPAPRRRTH